MKTLYDESILQGLEDRYGVRLCHPQDNPIDSRYLYLNPTTLPYILVEKLEGIEDLMGIELVSDLKYGTMLFRKVNNR